MEMDEVSAVALFIELLNSNGIINKPIISNKLVLLMISPFEVSRFSDKNLLFMCLVSCKNLLSDFMIIIRNRLYSIP
jgi:hypothetical protein